MREILCNAFRRPSCEELRGRHVQGHAALRGAGLGAGATALKRIYFKIRYIAFYIPVSGKHVFSSSKQAGDMKFLCLLIPN